jgi:hypothetical protein
MKEGTYMQARRMRENIQIEEGIRPGEGGGGKAWCWMWRIQARDIKVGGPGFEVFSIRIFQQT